MTQEIVLEIKIGATSSTSKAKKKASQVIERVVETLKGSSIQGVAVYETRFAFGGDSVALEISLPSKGQVIFRNVTEESASELVKKYTQNIKEIETVMSSDGQSCCSCNH
ncbi:MAG: hypothetical protein NTX05_01905 [Fusobacteria bacterium]|nr:hypothetical protein [Fusobacteriota bacterium]